MSNIPRRAMLGGAAVSAGAIVALAGRGTQSGAATVIPSGTMSVSDRTAMTALADMTVGRLVYLTEPGREGLFACVAGGAPGGDPLQGLSVPAAGGLHFARVWDGTHGRPEWFGAQANQWRFDCADAIEACYALCPVTQLAQSDYFIRRTLRFARSWRTVRGVGHYATDQDRGTRIILQGQARGIGRDDIMLVGSIAQPTRSSDDFPMENHFSNFTLIRDGACSPHPSGDITRYPTGLRISYVFRCTFREIASLESSVGIYVGGIVYTKLDDIMTQRTRAGDGGGRDYWVGFYLNGRPDFGFAGGNASLYINRCLAVEQHPAHVDAAGLRAEGAFVDTFLDGFESARIATGISIRAAGARNVGQTVDLHIRGAILDGCSGSGIDIDLDQTSSASIEIVDPYIYAAGSGGQRGIAIHDGAGLATITGGQVHGDFAGGSLAFARTRGITVQGTKLHQAIRPVVVDAASALVLEPQIGNVGKTAPGFAISCRGLVRSSVRPTVIGTGGPAFAGGIELDARCGYSQIDGSAIDPGCFRTVDAALKVRFAGADARAGGAFTAAGNVLTGVTG